MLILIFLKILATIFSSIFKRSRTLVSVWKWLITFETSFKHSRIKCFQVFSRNFKKFETFEIGWQFMKFLENSWFATLEINWYFLKTLENAWKCLKMLENSWKMFENTWKFMKIHENVWKCLKLDKITWKYLKIHENVWKCLKMVDNIIYFQPFSIIFNLSQTFSNIFRHFQTFSWIFKHFHGISCIFNHFQPISNIFNHFQTISNNFKKCMSRIFKKFQPFSNIFKHFQTWMKFHEISWTYFLWFETEIHWVQKYQLINYYNLWEMYQPKKTKQKLNKNKI